jgi:hypothetical protein
VPFGCGTASLVAMIVLFGAGAWAGSGKGGSIFAALFGTMQGEIHDMYTKDVTPAQKAAFDAEMNALRKNLSDGNVSIERLQPLLHEIRDASLDSKITPQETAALTKAAHDVNQVAKLPGYQGPGQPGSPTTRKP